MTGKVSGDVIKACWEGPPGAAKRPDMSATVLSQQETADCVARTLGILRAVNNTPFVPSSAHGLGGKGLRAFGLTWEDETSTYLCANQYSHGPSGLL